jgi:hypothetical protein
MWYFRRTRSPGLILRDIFFHDINVALAEANRDLTYQNGLLVTVLQTLQIPVKLPARKK